MPMTMRRPEILAPAGDEESLLAAIAAGADAVYLGLTAFSARARATNFGEDALERAIETLHRHGRKGYVALNTLVFDSELPALEASIRRCARAGVDAVIVQDLGVARLIHAIAPELPIHASTQMTCTDADSVELARELGASRVILARELSLHDIEAIKQRTSANALPVRRSAVAARIAVPAHRPADCRTICWSMGNCMTRRTGRSFYPHRISRQASLSPGSPS
jgi:putative protease